MLIQTLKSYASDVGETAVADVPASLKHWWKCDEAVGATTLVDAVGGANIPLGTNSVLTSSGGQITLDGNLAHTIEDAVTEAALTSPGTNHFMFMMYGDLPTSAAIYYGDNTTANHRIALAQGAGFSLVEGVTSQVFTDLISADEAEHHIVYDGTNISTYDDGVLNGAADAYGGGSLSSVGALMSLPYDLITNGMAMFVFAGSIPADVHIAAEWMGRAWAAGNKAIYPRALESSTWD